ncbi:MAG: hypothetical protein DRO94_01525 [Candidatus Altiarchaeales archaeon]|nr:MAG: hypothetical protein DRO95_01630 [Candidatus Altiarchaeales archaeon]RLI95038.1 MAG: hypothetical protein DRO94_01525 [Candidatus Altiarchaeales archaeon]HDO82268.1 hypothetical protein [Candidatus Altiarchaeales archaeon]HEX54917.1 hypothetical protein [Candidatus Altiarchaeales archaeon]
MQDRTKLYILAGAFSILLYLTGVFSGLFIEKSMTDYTERKVKSLQRRIENLQLEYAYLSIIGRDLSCGSLANLVNENTKKVWELGRELERGREFEDLRRDYALLSIKAWILNKYLEKRCNGNISVILYFYSVPCEECIQQGYILDRIREKFNNSVLIFVLNVDLDEPIVNTLKTTYSIRETPSIVINEETYSGLIQEENLTEIIRNSLR